jgi:hypothetical protein
LLSNNPLLAVLGVVFLVGALLLALGTFLVRREANAQAFVTHEDAGDIVQEDVSIADAVAAFEPRATGSVPPSAPRVVPAPPMDEIEIQLDQIERLVMVAQPWCVQELESAFLNHKDDRVRGAAEMALLAIRSRAM